MRWFATILLGLSVLVYAGASDLIMGGSVKMEGGFIHSGSFEAERDIGMKVKGSFNGVWYSTDWLTLSWELEGEATNTGAISNLTQFSPELEQMLLEFALPGALYFELGRQQFGVGEALLTKPSNLLDPTGDLEERALSFWQVRGLWSPGSWSVSMAWIPALFDEPPTARDLARAKWKGFLNSNNLGVITLGVSWFGYPVNFGIRGYLKERSAWKAEGFIPSGAFTATWNILPSLIVKGEFFLEYDSSESEAKIKTLGALVWGALPWLEFNAEYYFNDKGTPSAIPNLLEWGRHFLFLIPRLDFSEHDIAIRPGFLIEFEEGSARTSLEVEWAATDSLTLSLEGAWFEGKSGSLFDRVPQNLTASLGVSYVF